MYITGLIHRDRLFDVTTRWFADQIEDDDGLFISQVFTFESLVFAPTALSFMNEVGSLLRPGPHCVHRMYSKDQVRQLIIDSCPTPQARISDLFSQYRSNPEEFFPRTPVDLLAATSDDRRIVGMTRVKSIQRISDKASRRVADRLHGAIEAEAQRLAERRARDSAIPLQNLVSSEQQMVDEYAEAERRVSYAFSDREIEFAKPDLRIDDVIAVKLIGTPDELDKVEKAIWRHPSAAIAEREVHSGTYNDINLLVDFGLPPPQQIIDRVRGLDWSFAAPRGLNPATCDQDFAHYVETGARTFRMEVILSTFDELVESEFGRAIHEERILAQRRTAPYTGRIANNASAIIQFLMLLALSPKTKVRSLPFKMWGRYLSDSLALSLDDLFGVENDRRMFSLFAKHPLEIPGMALEDPDHAA